MESDPLLAKPIFGLSFVQVYVAPAVPEKYIISVLSPSQKTVLFKLVMTGDGLTVIVKVSLIPVQPKKKGVTTTSTLIGVIDGSVVVKLGIVFEPELVGMPMSAALEVGEADHENKVPKTNPSNM